MANRVELKEQELDSVIGGAFVYNTHTNADGSEYMTCRVNEGNTYYCSENAKRKISLYIMNNDNVTVQDVVDYALETGVFWE